MLLRVSPRDAARGHRKSHFFVPHSMSHDSSNQTFPAKNVHRCAVTFLNVDRRRRRMDVTRRRTDRVGRITRVETHARRDMCAARAALAPTFALAQRKHRDIDARRCDSNVPFVTPAASRSSTFSMTTTGRRAKTRARASGAGDDFALGELSERVSRVRDGSGARSYGVASRVAAPAREDVFDGLSSRAGRGARGVKPRSKTTTRSAREDGKSGSSAPGAVLELVTVPRTRARTRGSASGKERGEALTRLFEPL